MNLDVLTLNENGCLFHSYAHCRELTVVHASNLKIGASESCIDSRARNA